MNVQDHVNELLALTTCHCDPCWTERGRHAPECSSDYREDVDALVDEINRLNGFTPQDERRARERRTAARHLPERKFPNLPESKICGFACFRNRHHRGLHQWEATKAGWTVAQWREHLAETSRPAACILDAGRWTEVREPCD